MTRDFHLPGRSPVHGRTAMAATSHPLATSAALDVLREGGNAVDAAVAAVAVQSVVEPHMTGIGGDCFALVAEPDGSLYALNGSGRAPADIDPAHLRAQGLTRIEENSIHSVTVPGAIRAWESLLQSHGRWSMAQTFAAAIDYAEHGFPVAPRVAWDWSRHVAELAADEGAARHYLRDGAAPKAGDLYRLPALAETLQAIAEGGSAAFYEGRIGEEIAATVQAKGGFLRVDDLAAMEVTPVTPVSGTYRGVEVLELPPNGHGIAALVMLNILEHFDLAGLDPNGPERLHLEMEAARLAYSVRDLHIADPAAMTVKVEQLVAKEFAAGLAGHIDMSRRLEKLSPAVLSPDSDTVYLTVVDGEGRAVSFINSLYRGFGVHVATRKSGILLQNRGACFNLEPGHPNCIAGGKRPLHTIIPALARKDGRPWLSFGVMGGSYQPCGHAHVLANILDYGMDVQQAIDAPRVFFDRVDGPLVVETTIGAATRDGLVQRGHQIRETMAPHGGGQAIMIGKGVLTGASDPRKDGCALGW